MTRPRKEQIDATDTKFSLLPAALTSTTAPPVTPALGLSSSVTWTTTGSNPYLTFINSSVTKQFGGAIEDTAAFLKSSVQGPFNDLSGMSFTILIPELSVSPYTVTVQVGDVVNLNGGPVLPASRLAARINTVVGSAVASNQNGYLQIKSITTGKTAIITVQDVTAGILNAIFGSGSSPTLVAHGVSSPTRGIVSQSADGKGGVIQLRLATGEPCVTVQSRRLHMGNFKYLPDAQLGQVIYGRLTAVPGASATVSLVTNGKNRPSVNSASSNFSTLTGADSVQITITEPSLGSPTIFTVTFDTTTTVQHVVDVLNAGWGAALSPSPVQGIVSITKSTFSFQTGANFYIYLNGHAVNVTVGPTIITAAQLLSTISAAIVSAGQTGQGAASLGGGILQIQSSNTTGYGSTVELRAGTPIISGGPLEMTALNEIGTSPGVYSGSVIAQLYGLDEITILNPSRNPGSTLAMTGSGTLTKLGLTGFSSVGAIVGEEPAFPNVEVKAIYPESMSFSEVPVNYEGTIEAFQSPNRTAITDPTLGIQNAGKPVVAGLDGKIPSDVLEHLIDTLSLDQINLGARNTGSIANLLKSRIIAGGNSGQGPMLLSTFPDIQNSGPTTRVYLDPAGYVLITQNAIFQASGVWGRDTAANAFCTKIGNGQDTQLVHLAGEGSTWPDSIAPGTNWRELSSVGLTSGGGLLESGFGNSDSLVNNLVARLRRASFTNGYCLLEQDGVTGIQQNRTYIKYQSSDQPTLAFSINAAVDTTGNNWTKDVTNKESCLIAISTNAGSIRYESAGTPGPINSWTNIPFSWDFSTGTFSGTGNVSADGSANIGTFIAVGGNGFTNETSRQLYRIRVDHSATVALPSLNYTRTRVASFTGGSFQHINNTYRGTGFNNAADSLSTNPTQDMFFEAMNASWDGTNWNKDTTADIAVLIVYTNRGRTTFMKTGTAAFADSAWVYVNSNRDTGFYGAIGQGASLTTPPSANYFNNAVVPKAWGSVVIIGGATNATYNPFNPDPQFEGLDSWNVNTGGYDYSGADNEVFEVPFILPITQNGACVLSSVSGSTPVSAGVFTPVAAPVMVSSGALVSSTMAHFTFATGTNTALAVSAGTEMNIRTLAQGVVLNFLVMGRQ